jgi:hypothetical protein
MSGHGTHDAPEFSGFAEDLASILAAPSSPEMEKRIEDERKATRTPKQRARKAVRTEQVNFRVSVESKALLAAVAETLQISATDVFMQALDEYAKRKKITVPS